MDQITDKGIILMVLVSDLLIIVGVTVVLLIGRWLSGRQSDVAEQIVRLSYFVSIALTIVFGLIAETIVVLRIFWIIGLI